MTNRKEQPEYTLQKQVAQYLRIQYPDVFFLSDTVASVKLTIPQQVRNKAIQCPTFSCPDLLILQPNENYNGLFIELKAETPYKKDGTLKKSDHLEAQWATLGKLMARGYSAMFAWEFEQVKGIIDNYLKDA
jgi:hypothetical protein